MAKTFKTGDRVAYSARFCRNIGATTGEIPFLRGTVVGVHKLPTIIVVKVLWDDGAERGVLDSNLAIVGPNRQFANCD